MPPTRAKFRCQSIEMTSTEPQPVMRYEGGKAVPSEETTWPRTYRFSAEYDHTVPEDRRYAKYTPIGELRIVVDNPNVNFEPGKQYYLDFTPVDEAPEE